MSVQIIKGSAAFEPLESWGAVKAPLSEPACQLRGTRRAIPGFEEVRAGVWECSPGSYRRDVKEGEVMHILAGECTFTPEGQEPIAISAGDTIFCPANTIGVWDMKSAVRKVFVILP